MPPTPTLWDYWSTIPSADPAKVTQLRLRGVAVSMALQSGRNLSRQPTWARAIALADALRPELANLHGRAVIRKTPGGWWVVRVRPVA